jgi:hypothetical protein
MHRWLSSLVLAAFGRGGRSPPALVLAQTATSTPAKPLRRQSRQPRQGSDAREGGDAGTRNGLRRKPRGVTPTFRASGTTRRARRCNAPAGKGETVDEGEANQFEEQLAYDLSRDRRDGGPEST